MDYLKTKTHISWMIAAWCLGFLLGVAGTGAVDSVRFDIQWLIGCGTMLAVVALISRMRLLVPVMVLAGVLMGLARGSSELVGLNQLRKLVGTEATIWARVDDDPVKNKGKQTMSLELRRLVVQGREYRVADKAWASIKASGQVIRRSDQLALRGVLDNGFGSYAISLPSATVVKAVATSDGARDVRDNFALHLGRVLDGTEAGLGMGIIAGQKSSLDSDIRSAFVAASLTHILVASGYNLTVLVRLSRRLLAKRSRLLAVLLSLLLIVLFANLAGWSASMSRAVLVSVISLLTWYVGRYTHPVILLLLTAAITAAIEPSSLWGDAGWYLSFGSFAGVIILAPLLNDFIAKITGWQLTDNAANDEPKSPLATVGQIFVETASAQITTWLLIAFFVGRISLVGLVTNILVLPLLPLAMMLTALTGVAVYVLPSALAAILAYPAKWLLDFIVATAQWGATLPGASVEWRPTTMILIVYYALLLLVIIWLKQVTNHNFYHDNVIE